MIGVASAPGGVDAGRIRAKLRIRSTSPSKRSSSSSSLWRSSPAVATSLAPKATRAVRVFFDRVIRSPTEQDGPTAPCPADRGRRRDE